MSLTSYRAAPPRVTKYSGFERSPVFLLCPIVFADRTAASTFALSSFGGQATPLCRDLMAAYAATKKTGSLSADRSFEEYVMKGCELYFVDLATTYSPAT